MPSPIWRLAPRRRRTGRSGARRTECQPPYGVAPGAAGRQPDGAAIALHRSARAERRGQDHAVLADHAALRHATWIDRCARPSCVTRARQGVAPAGRGVSGAYARSRHLGHRQSALSRRAARHRRPRGAQTRACRTARRSNWPTAPGTQCAGYRADRCGGSRSRALCCIGRASWCWTSRQSDWMLRPAPPSCAMCARWCASAALPCCGRRICSTRSPPTMRSSCCIAGRVLAAGDVPDVVASAGAADMRSAFIALTGGATEAPE